MCSINNGAHPSFIICTSGSLQANSSNNKITSSKIIVLPEEPKENVTLDFSLNCSGDFYYGIKHETSYVFSYELKLTFENNLHEVSGGYEYFISFYAYVPKDDQRTFEHRSLFSHQEVRTTGKMDFVKKKFNMINLANKLYSPYSNGTRIDTSVLWHICCTIYRRNNDNVTTYLSKLDGIGAMLLNSGNYSDVSLVIGDKTLRAHKHVLSLKSKVFEAMFSHNMTENLDGIIAIDDLDFEVVEALLEYIYTENPKVLYKRPLDLFVAAHKYEISMLQRQCLEYFLFNVKTENVIDVISLASLFEMKDLKMKLMKFLQAHETEMVRVEEYKQFLINDLKIDTIIDTLKLCDKYHPTLGNVEVQAFEFAKQHKKALEQNDSFLALFQSHTSLTRRLYFYVH